MIRLSRKTILALEAVVDIAYNARPEPVQAKEITSRQGVPQRYLEQVMQRLVHAGILRGVRGPKGGYRLARERRRITAGEVVRIVALMEAEELPPLDNGSELAEKVVRPLIESLHKELLARLDAITIDDLCIEAEAQNVPLAVRTKLDFTI